jgi:two-component system LytT family response regulator
MIRTLLADDEPPARDKLARWLGEHADIQLVGIARDGIGAAEAIEALQPQVAFLDIQMPGFNGLEIAAQLEAATAPLLVFVTAFDEHAVKAFELNAVDYLLKPYDKERFSKCLSRVRARLSDMQVRAIGINTARAQVSQREGDQSGVNASGRLLVPVGEQLQLIDVESIEWLQADDNYVHVHAAGRKYLLRRTLADLLAQLGEQRFVRIHKSSIANLAQIQSLTPLFKGDYEVVLRTGQRLRMSRRYREAVFARMGR